MNMRPQTLRIDSGLTNTTKEGADLAPFECLRTTPIPSPHKPALTIFKDKTVTRSLIFRTAIRVTNLCIESWCVTDVTDWA